MNPWSRKFIPYDKSIIGVGYAKNKQSTLGFSDRECATQANGQLKQLTLLRSCNHMHTEVDISTRGATPAYTSGVHELSRSGLA